MKKVADCRIFNKRLINMFLNLLSSFFFPSLGIISWACFRPLSRQLEFTDPGDHLVMFSAPLKSQRRKKKPISVREISSLDIQRKGYENQVGTFNLKALQRICRKTIRFFFSKLAGRKHGTQRWQITHTRTEILFCSEIFSCFCAFKHVCPSEYFLFFFLQCKRMM